MLYTFFNSISARRWLKNITQKRPKDYDEALRTLEEARDIIREQNDKILRLIYEAHSDKLTGLLNKRGFTKTLDYEAEQSGIPTSDTSGSKGVVISIDMARLKSLNDEYGHAAGDKAIKTFAKTLKKQIRRSDFAARVGGDEFIAILRDTTQSEAEPRISALKAALTNLAFEHGGITHTVSARFGLAQYDAKTPVRTAIERADQNQIEARKSEPASMKRGAP